MPATVGTTIFVGMIVTMMTLCCLYNLVRIGPERRELERFNADPSCRQMTIVRRSPVGACHIAVQTLVGTPEAVQRRGGTIYILTLRSPTGNTSTVEVGDGIINQVRRGVKTIGTLSYKSDVIVVFAGPKTERQLAYPSLDESYTMAIWSGTIALLFSIPLVMRICQRTGLRPKT